MRVAVNHVIAKIAPAVARRGNAIVKIVIAPVKSVAARI